jgi:cystathionine gamma-synthase
MSFDVADAASARRVETATKLIANMTSLGGVTSRIEARERWEGERVPPGLLRVSIGLEDAEELWSDLEQALAHG